MTIEVQAPQMCPLLTAAALIGLKKPTLVIAGAAPQPEESEAVACIRSACQWYVPIADEKGVIRGGNCAVSLLPTSLAQITGEMKGVVQVLAHVAKVKLSVIPSK